MIKIIDNKVNINSFLQQFTKGDPFGCRIYSLFNCYNCELPFVDFWVQINNGMCTAAISRLGTQFVAQITQKADIEELSSFFRISGSTSVLCDYKYKLDVFAENIESGAILKFFGNPYDINSDNEIIEPTIEEAFKLLNICSDKGFETPDFESFNLDVSHKLRHNTIRMIGVNEKDKLAAVGMTVAETGTDAVLGAIASHPQYRNKGLGSLMVQMLTNSLLKENKNIYLHRAMDKNISFYSRLGYKVYGKWCEYIF